MMQSTHPTHVFCALAQVAAMTPEEIRAAWSAAARSVDACRELVQGDPPADVRRQYELAVGVEAMLYALLRKTS